MKKGWMIYLEEDGVKNLAFFQMVKQALKRHEIDLDLHLIGKEEEELPLFDADFVINRTRQAAVGEFYERKGIVCFHPSFVTEIANDKEKTYEVMKQAGLSVLETERLTPFGESALMEEIFAKKEPCVVKTADGHGGSEVFCCHSKEEVQALQKAFAGRKLLVQRFCDTPGVDVRYYVLGGRILVAMKRTSKTSFRSNFSLGGEAEVYAYSKQEEALVMQALSALGTQDVYMGLDFLFHQGKPVFHEAEDVVGARMVYAHTSVDVAKEWAEWMASRLFCEKRTEK